MKTKERNITNNNGLFVDQQADPPTCTGYIINLGPYTGDPCGEIEVDGRKPTMEEIEIHNNILANMEWDGMLRHGRGSLYCCSEGGRCPAYWASQFGGQNRIYIGRPNRSRNNFGCERLDFQFRMPGDPFIWWGRKQGDDQILRVRRTKSK